MHAHTHARTHTHACAARAASSSVRDARLYRFAAALGLDQKHQLVLMREAATRNRVNKNFKWVCPAGARVLPPGADPLGAWCGGPALVWRPCPGVEALVHVLVEPGEQ